MAYEISKSFNKELNLITIFTMIAIFIVVAITFKSFIIPLILVFIIQCAVYITMSILSLTGTNCYFISLLIVQSILMGATIDYAIVYTTYYIEIDYEKDETEISFVILARRGADYLKVFEALRMLEPTKTITLSSQVDI